MQFGAHTDTRPGQAPPLELLDLAIDDEPDASAAPVAPSTVSPRRRVWLVGGLAVVLLGVGVYLRTQTVQPPPVPAPVATPATIVEPTIVEPTPPLGLEGFAELYVSAYLTATGPERQTTIERYFPAAPEMSNRSVFDRYVTRSVVVAAQPVDDDMWSFVVAAEVLAFDGRTYVLDGTHHYAVAINAPDGRPAAATTLPVRVAAPPVGDIAAVVVGTPLTDQNLHALAKGFVRSYTTGADELYRYTTAGFAADGIAPPPFERVTIDDVSAVQITSELLQLRVAGLGTPTTGAPIRIEYHLVVAVEGGAWKVAGLAAGPLTASQLAQTEGNARTSIDDES